MSKLVAAVAFILLVAPAMALAAEGDLNYRHDPIGQDMFNQYNIKPQEGYYGRNLTYPTKTIPTRGKEPAMTKEEADTKMTNPVTATTESLRRGRWAFSKYCSACHGPDGKSQTPVAQKLTENGAPLWDITLTAAARSDGYLYGLIRNGGMNMPAYGAQTTSLERWDIVNYLRSLQPK